MFLPNDYMQDKGSPERLDLAQAMLGNASSAAAGSGNPLLQFMGPLAGALLGSNIQRQRDDYRSEQEDGARDFVLGQIKDPRAGPLLDILNNPNLPDSYKQVSKGVLQKILNPPKPKKAPGRKMREDVNGILRYLDTGEQVFEGVTKTGGSTNNAGNLRQINEATTILDRAISDQELYGLSRDEARDAVRNDPLYSQQWAMIEGQGNSAAPVANPAPSAQPAPAEGSENWVDLGAGVRIREIP